MLFMSNIMTLRNLKLKIKNRDLICIKQASVDKGSVIGLIGANGSGKSTLLNYIVGYPNSSDVVSSGELISKVHNIGYYEQETSYYHCDSKEFDYTLLSKHGLDNWKKKTSYDHMSGGEKSKRRLLDVFSKKTEMLVLDEPTNHMDQEGLVELVNLIKHYKGAIILVSHDHSFIEKTCDTIWEIKDQELISFKGSLSEYEEDCQRKLKEQQRAKEKKLKEQKQLEKELQSLKNWSASAHAQSTKQEFPKEFYRSKAKRMDSQRKSAEKRLVKKMKESEDLDTKSEKITSYDFDTGHYKKGKAILLDDISFKFDKEKLIEKLSLTINFGDKLVIKGGNGSGKTTLFKLIMGEVVGDKVPWVSEFAKIGYLTQSIKDWKNDQTLEEYVSLTPNMRQRLVLLATQLGFSTEQLQQNISLFSKGEQLKVELLYFMMREVNILILDEPTNHLDYPSRQALARVLKAYPGTVIVASHDEKFTNEIATCEFILGRQTNKTVSSDVSVKKKSKLLLEMEKDRLMSELSFLSQGDEEYNIKNDRFIEVVRVLKEYE
ncbi:hypothetical protein CBF31_02145 [Vagococcus fessus]|uniref:ABC transporter domain-containing protein n=2 Tax=Vagococcus fessus TaxID=120370 RepID=A0A430ACA5_9ENTE|nr:hypothetical protein CBF31_02145 [Vagococcus fessus]